MKAIFLYYFGVYFFVEVKFFSYSSNNFLKTRFMASLISSATVSPNPSAVHVHKGINVFADTSGTPFKTATNPFLPRRVK